MPSNIFLSGKLLHTVLCLCDHDQKLLPNPFLATACDQENNRIVRTSDTDALQREMKPKSEQKVKEHLVPTDFMYLIS